METDSTKTELKAKVLDRISQEDLSPRSRLYFTCYEMMVWVFWVMSVLLGAVAIAISLFAITHQKYAFYEATHENFFVFMIDVLPYLWFVILAFMVVLAVINIRHTKKGYRYPWWQIFMSSFVLSLIGGYALNFAGMGFMVDKKLGQYIVLYQSQEKTEEKLWQDPEEGRLVGFLIPSANASETETSEIETVKLKDIESNIWEVNIVDLLEDDLIILNSGKKMKVLGKVISFTPPHFHACGVLPWMFEKNRSIGDLSYERKAIIDRLYFHKDRNSENKISADSSETNDICGQLKVVHRIQMMPE